MATDYTTSTYVGGSLVTAALQSAADTYYDGMPLKYVVTPTAAAGGSNTGNGTCTVLSAGKDVPSGAYTVTFTAALVAKITDPDGKVLRIDLTVTDGGATAFNVDGLKFTLTDGATAWVATDTFTITVGTAGTYAYTATEPEVICWETKTLSSAGKLLCAVAGSEILDGALVSDSNAALTVTNAMRSKLKDNGIVLRKEA